MTSLDHGIHSVNRGNWSDGQLKDDDMKMKRKKMMVNAGPYIGTQQNRLPSSIHKDMDIIGEIIRDGGMVSGGNPENAAGMENLNGKWNSPPVTPPVPQDGGVSLDLGESHACDMNKMRECRAPKVKNNKKNEKKEVIGGVRKADGATHASALQNGDADQQRGKKKFKGVTWYKRTKRWEAYVWATIDDNGKQYHLGSFPSQEEAAKAYDLALIKLRGEQAKTNFPREIYKKDEFLAKHGNDGAKDFILALKKEFLLRQGLKPRAHAVQKRNKAKRKVIPGTKKSKVTGKVTDVVNMKPGVKHQTPNPPVAAPDASLRFEKPGHHESLWRPEEHGGGYQNYGRFTNNQPNMSIVWPQMSNNNAAMYNPGVGMNAARIGPIVDNYLAGLPLNLQQQPTQDRYLESRPMDMMDNHFSQRSMPAEAIYQPSLHHNTMENVPVNMAEQYRSLTRQDMRGEQLKDLLNMEELLQIDWRSIFPDEYAV